MKAINWNKIDDPVDLEVWNRVTANFWLPEKIALSNDIPSWNTMSEEEMVATGRVFANLTLLDTLQSIVGAPTLMQHAQTQHEEAVLANFSFMEAVHAKSYSSIFTTLMSMEDIEQLFEWVNHNEFTQRKAHIVKSFYDGAITAGRGELYSQCMAKAASVMLESFLFYSGFYLPFYFASRAKLTNTADIIRLILRDEGVHGYYIGYKFQQVRAELSDRDRDALDMAVHELLDRLYDNELQFTEYIYDDLGWTENVKTYLRYNANKALANLGYQPRFDSESTNVEPAILANMQLDTAETHDFFSGSGSSYVMGTVEETTDDDWY